MPEHPRFPDVIEPPPGFERDPAWSAYDSAFRDAAAGDVTQARKRLRALAARWPWHPARARAVDLTQQRAARRRASTSDTARGELVFWSTLGGLSLAGNLCVAIDCASDRDHAAAYTLSVGGAVAASLWATRRGVAQGEAQLYNSAQTWAVWNALAINDGFAGDKTEASVAIGMQLGGIGAGFALWQTWHPTEGDVALTNTFLVWGTMMTLWGHLVADEVPALSTLVIAGDLSMLAGALVSQEVKVSRGRTLLIDVGGILGSLTGGLVALGTSSDSTAGIVLMLGTGAGLAVAAAGTAGWDKGPPVKVAPSVVEGPGRSRGYGLIAGLAF